MSDKPKPEMVPFTRETVPLEARWRYKILDQYQKQAIHYRIVAFDHLSVDFIAYSPSRVSYESLLDNWEYCINDPRQGPWRPAGTWKQ